MCLQHPRVGEGAASLGFAGPGRWDCTSVSIFKYRDLESLSRYLDTFKIQSAYYLDIYILIAVHKLQETQALEKSVASLQDRLED